MCNQFVETIAPTLLQEKRHLSAMLCCAAIVAFAGCEGKPPLGSLIGRVTYQDRPVTEGYVVMSSDGTGVHISAELDSQGRYSARTAAGEGIPPGTYDLAVVPPSMPIPDTVNPGRLIPKPYPMIPTRYRSTESSGLKVTIQDGANAPFDIDMRP